MALRHDPDLATLRQAFKAQPLGADRPVGLIQHAPVDSKLMQRQVAPVQNEGRVVRPLKLQQRGDTRVVFKDADIKVDGHDLAGWRQIV